MALGALEAILVELRAIPFSCRTSRSRSGCQAALAIRRPLQNYANRFLLQTNKPVRVHSFQPQKTASSEAAGMVLKQHDVQQTFSIESYRYEMRSLPLKYAHKCQK